MRKIKKIGYIDINNKTLEYLKSQFKDINFCDIRNSRHKIFDVVLCNDSITDEERTLYEIFNTFLINISASTYKNMIELINIGVRRFRHLTCDQIQYINVINKYHYLNEKVEKLVDEKNSHSLKVAYITKTFCDKFHLSEERTLDLYMGALFHDIGKIFIDPNILCKKGKLNKEEFDEIKKHPIYGYELLKGHLKDEILLIIRDHHKRENNQGYPVDEIPLDNWSALIGLSDSYDAITSERVYSKPASKEYGINELLLCSKEEKDGGKGITFNPYITELFVKAIK